MQHLIDDTRKALEAGAHYAALTQALTIPDQCGYAEWPKRNSKDRYIAWFKQNLLHAYTQPPIPGEPEHVFLSGADCYALRCAFLHQGEFDLTSQKAQEVLERIHFIQPPEGMLVHRNQTNNVLQLQVDCFCEEMCSAAEAWLGAISVSSETAKRLQSLPRISANPSFSPFLIVT